MKVISLLLFIFISWTLSACATVPPKKPNNLCSIFQEKKSWYEDALEVHKKRGVPINIAMAFIYHESGYREDAKPPMRWFLFIPYGRGSSAYGYPQAQDEVWGEYLDDDAGFWASRSNFKDSLDFVSWYMLKTKKKNGIALTDAYNQYLNYHEGWGGYKKKTYAKNSSLKKLATRVKNTSANYAKQLRNCRL